MISQLNFSHDNYQQGFLNRNFEEILFNRNRDIFFQNGIGFLVVLIPTVLLIAKLQNGIILSSDSLTYLYAARGLLNNGTLLYLYGENNLTIFPPLYPLMLAMIQKVGFTGEFSASLINIGSMAISSMAIYLYIIRIFSNIIIAGIFSLLIFIHPQMQGVFMYAYSEPVFIALFSLILLILTFLDKDHLYKISLITGLSIGLAFLTRYGALAIIPAVFIGILSFNSASFMAKIKACLLISVSCAILMVPWLVRNYLEDGTLFGPRVESEDTILFALRRIALVTTEYLSPFHTKKYLKLGLGITFVMLYGFISTLYLNKFAYKNPVLVTSFVFVITHAVLMVYTQVQTVVDPIDTRYLSPLIPSIVLVLIGSVYYLTEKYFKRPGMIVICIGAIFLLFHGIQSYLQVTTESKIAGHLAIQPQHFPAEYFTSGSAVYSNDFKLLRYNQIFPQAKALPRQYIYRRNIRRDDRLPFLDSVKEKPAYLIWIKNSSLTDPSNEELLGGPSEDVHIELILKHELFNVYRSSLVQAKETETR
ncbi:hypothetical protein BH23BAC1_BH23BAC1_46140 [soil metagenome]